MSSITESKIFPALSNRGALGNMNNGPNGISSNISIVREKAIWFIDHNLSALQLRPATIAEGIHVSRAVLYRAFQADGGVANFLHERRLAKARLMLEERAGEPGIVTKVALAHGYSNTVRFSRLFASRFAEPPTRFVRRLICDHQEVS